MKKQRVIELAVKVVVAALTAFLTALEQPVAWETDRSKGKRGGDRRCGRPLFIMGGYQGLPPGQGPLFTVLHIDALSVP